MEDEIRDGLKKKINKRLEKMKTQNKKNQALFIVFILAIIALVTTACGFHTSRLGEITQVVDINLDEDSFGHSRPTFVVNGHNFWDGLLKDVDRVELHDGYLRFVGTGVQSDGSRVEGSIDVNLAAQNGMLLVKVIAVNIPGVELSDPIVIEINEDLETDLPQLDFYHDMDVYFNSVEVKEDGLRMQIQVNVRF